VWESGLTEQCGTPAYIAPEVLEGFGFDGFKADIWSAGVVLYAMLLGTVPFKANNMSELQKLILKAKYTIKEDTSDTQHKPLSNEAKELIQLILEREPSFRP
jgi:5'-AMP-activated protein kinase catalytic alpha subunit